jgi:hypothetical protein
VALGAIGGAVSAGIGPSGLAGSIADTTGSALLGKITSQALGNALTQGIAVAVGAQDKFSWKSVAASAVGGGVSGAIGGSFGTDPFGQFANRAVSGFAGGLTTAALRGGARQRDPGRY